MFFNELFNLELLGFELTQALTYEGQREVLKTALAPKKDFYCVKHGGTEFYYRLLKDGDRWLIRQLDSEDVYYITSDDIDEHRTNIITRARFYGYHEGINYFKSAEGKYGIYAYLDIRKAETNIESSQYSIEYSGEEHKFDVAFDKNAKLTIIISTLFGMKPQILPDSIKMSKTDAVTFFKNTIFAAQQEVAFQH